MPSPCHARGLLNQPCLRPLVVWQGGQTYLEWMLETGDSDADAHALDLHKYVWFTKDQLYAYPLGEA